MSAKIAVHNDDLIVGFNSAAEIAQMRESEDFREFAREILENYCENVLMFGIDEYILQYDFAQIVDAVTASARIVTSVNNKPTDYLGIYIRICELEEFINTCGLFCNEPSSPDLVRIAL